MANAKGYRAKTDVSFPKVIAKNGEDYVTEGVNYPTGSVIPHDSLTPFIQKRIENGELDGLISPVDDDVFDAEMQAQQAGEPTTGIFIAEHEAEAHALRMGGHIVVPKEQALEVASSGQEHSRRYQEAVRNAGLDRRRVQEHYAGAESEEGRVPDYLLEGAEHRTGLPHDRGPAFQGSDEDDEQDETPAARPRPGNTQAPDDQSDGSESEGESDQENQQQENSGQEPAQQQSGVTYEN